MEVAFLGGLVAFGRLSFQDAVQLLVCTALLGTCLVLVLVLHRVNRQLRALRTGFDRQVREFAEISGENRVELVGRADDLAERLDRLELRLTSPGVRITLDGRDADAAQSLRNLS
ncbi:hypothetical protein SUDANB121_02260 [Nocardiopsis dassonvillei]